MNDEPSLEMLLHSRILEHAWPIYRDGHWAPAAHSAFVVVEYSLAEKHPALAQLFGKELVNKAFSDEARLALPERLDPKTQKHVPELFRGMFGYYRNYCGHKAENVDEIIAARILVVASELLDLIDASERSYTLSGGVAGLVKEGVFDNEEQFYSLLALLDGYVALDDTWDGLFETLGFRGFSEEQFECVFDLGLVRIDRQLYSPPSPQEARWYDPTTLDEIHLTDAGRGLLADAPCPED